MFVQFEMYMIYKELARKNLSLYTQYMPLFSSISKVLECIQFGFLKSKLNFNGMGGGLWGNVNDEKMRVLRSMGLLHEALFHIQMEIAEANISLDSMNVVARKLILNNANENDIKLQYKRIRALELQKQVLCRSEKMVNFTMTGLEEKFLVENMHRILSNTVTQHNLAQDTGLFDACNENLITDLDQVANSVAQTRNTIHHIDETLNEVENDASVDTIDLDSDTNYNVWKSKMMIGTENNISNNENNEPTAEFMSSTYKKKKEASKAL